MIFYFSGTGNSYYVAKSLAAKLGDTIMSIAEAVENENYTYQLGKNEAVGFVYPIHAWIPPKIVLSFAEKLSLSSNTTPYVYSIFTFAGVNEGAWKSLSHHLKKANISLKGDYHILMPGNYLLGVNKLSEEEITSRIETADLKIEKISLSIQKQEANYIKKSYSFLKHHVVNKLFQMTANHTPFMVNNNCVGCAKCIKACSLGALSLHEHKPVQNAKLCIQCMGCINRCPVEAIDFSKKTKGKKRYVHPIYRT